MPLGILQPKSQDHVPGTTRYFDDLERPQIATASDTALKCDRSGPQPIILVPQPSDDPNDPLNWPLWRRDLITFILSITAIFATSLGSILASNTMVMTIKFSVTFTHVALMTGYFLLGVGGAAVFFVPSARVWGKRHALILGLVILIFSSAWAGSAHNSQGRSVGKNFDAIIAAGGIYKPSNNPYYKSFIAARVIQGVGCAPYETLVNAVVSDLYFVHQRGVRMAFTNLAVFGGAFFTPIVVGKITSVMGWWWSFYFITIFCAICLPAVFFFCPEMAYRRAAALNIDMLARERTPTSSQSASPSADEMGSSEGVEKPLDGPSPHGAAHHQPEPSAEMGHAAPGTALANGATHVPPKKTFVQSLALFDGRKTDESYWKLLLRPFALVLQPAFAWACLAQGTMIGWTVFIGAIIASIFTAPPYWWDEVENGYAYVGPFVGALIGFLLAGALADSSVKFLTKRNKGIYEPEFRLFLMVPSTVVGCAGIYGFGITASQVITNKYHWSVPIVFFGLQVAGMVMATVSSSLYIVDAYRDLAIEGFTMFIIFKNFFSYVLTYFAFDWVTKGLGIRTTITIIASIQVAVCLTTVPMYIYGKQIRASSHKRDILKVLNLR